MLNKFSASRLMGIFAMLKNDFHFERACIPLNPRNSKVSSEKDDSNKPSPVSFNKNGIPLCPKDQSEFIPLGKSKGKHRSTRFKFVCPKSKPNGKTRICTCNSLQIMLDLLCAFACERIDYEVAVLCVEFFRSLG